MLISLDFTTLVANTIERPIGSDGSPYEKRVDAKGRVTSDKCIANEVPFEELPEGWCWTRLSNVASIQLGKMLDKQKNQGDLAPYLGNANVQWGRFDLTNVKTMPMGKTDRAKYALSHGDLIVCEGGVPGRCAIWTSNETMHYQKALHRIRCSKRLLLNTCCELYICFLVQSHVWDSCFTGTTIKHLPAQTLSSWLLPLPPLAEQRRIVERVNELMPLVEEYGRLEDAREELDAALPGRLRKSVLQLAVQGGLVPQDPADEPAGVLLERIRGRRRQLVAKGEMKAPKGGESIIFAGSDGRRYEKRVDARGRESEPVCIEDEIPFEIPEGWEWARLETLGTIIGGGTPKTGVSEFWSDEVSGIPWITPADMSAQSSIFISAGKRFISNVGLEKSSAQLLPTGSVLMSSRAPIGYLGIAANPIATNQGFKSVALIDNAINHWLICVLEAIMDSIAKRASGTTFKEISGAEFGKTLVPLPPVEEQTRILSSFKRLSIAVTNQ